MPDYDIANLAFDHLKITRKIGSLNETSEEAKAANRWYNIVRQEILKAFNWNWQGAEKRAVLVLDAVTANFHPEWMYAYTPPAGMLKPRRLIPYTAGASNPAYRNVPVEWKIPFLWGNLPDGSGKRIYTDLPSQSGVSPILAYTPDVTDTANWPDNFQTAVSYALAIRMAPILKTDSDKILKELWPKWVAAWAVATADEVTQGQSDPAPEASWILARN